MYWCWLRTIFYWPIIVVKFWKYGSLKLIRKWLNLWKKSWLGNKINSKFWIINNIVIKWNNFRKLDAR